MLLGTTPLPVRSLDYPQQQPSEPYDRNGLVQVTLGPELDYGIFKVTKIRTMC